MTSYLGSYSSGKSSVSAIIRETIGLYHKYSGNSSKLAERTIRDARRTERVVAERLGLEIRGLDILEIGPGQMQGQLIYFSILNRVVGIDLEVLVRGFRPLDYMRMVKANGSRRALKTIGRKLLGFDRSFACELRRQLNQDRLPNPKVLQMDAANMTFPKGSFDFVYSRAVFHHLTNPGAAIDSIVRVLKPGGGCYVSLHLYTSETGCLDPRVYSEKWNEVRGWPHLRPRLPHFVERQGIFVNKTRLDEWRALFTAKMPDAQFILTQSENANVEAAVELHNRGELLEYSLEELLTGDFTVVWQKPRDSNTR